MSSLARIDFRAVIRSPLRSKRAITSPLRARSNASGLTRIRVRLTGGAPLLWFRARPLLRGAARRLFLAAAARGRGSRGARRGLFAPLLRPAFALAAPEAFFAVG